jgi:hypothetical protein
MTENKQKKKILILSVLAFIAALAVAGVIIYGTVINGSGVVYNHATDYDCEIGEFAFLDDHWSLRKKEDNGVVYLDLWNPGLKDDVIAKRYSYYIYDSEGDARDAFDRRLNYYRDLDLNFEEGDNWFVSEDPYACDARVVFMRCIEKNVIIYCEVECWGEAAVSVDGDNPNTYIDQTDLKDYAIKNSSKLRKYGLEDVLGID